MAHVDGKPVIRTENVKYYCIFLYTRDHFMTKLVLHFIINDFQLGLPIQ